MQGTRFYQIAAIVSAVCFSVGTLIFAGTIMRAAMPTETTVAAATNYTTKWQATRVFRAQYGERDSALNGRYNFSNKPYVSIGVSEWQVKGSVPSSSVRFKEVWSAPGGSTMQATIARPLVVTNCYGYNPCWVDFDPRNPNKEYSATSGAAQDKYLIGYAGNPALRITSVPVDSGNRWSYGFGHPTFAWGNGAMFCRGGDRDCLYASGSYGFTDAESMAQARGSSQVTAGGIFQPLEWTINGFVCTEATDTQCH
jgi:hypothetical protein